MPSIMKDRERWEQLAADLGFELKEGITAFLESAAAQRFEMERGGSGGQAAQMKKFLQHPAMQKLLAAVFLGVVAGTYRGYEFNIYRSGQSGSQRNLRTTAIALIFNRYEQRGLQIYREYALIRFFRTLFHGQDIASGNRELDRLVVVKADDVANVQVMLSSLQVQRALRELFAGRNEITVSDHGIRYKRHGTLPRRDEALPVMERMVDAARAMGY